MDEFDKLIQYLYSTNGRELTPEKTAYIKKTYGDNQEGFVRSFYGTIGKELTPKDLTYLNDNYLKKKDSPEQSVDDGGQTSSKDVSTSDGVVPSTSKQSNTYGVETNPLKIAKTITTPKETPLPGINDMKTPNLGSETVQKVVAGQNDQVNIEKQSAAKYEYSKKVSEVHAQVEKDVDFLTKNGINVDDMLYMPQDKIETYAEALKEKGMYDYAVEDEINKLKERSKEAIIKKENENLLAQIKSENPQYKPEEVQKHVTMDMLADGFSMLSPRDKELAALQKQKFELVSKGMDNMSIEDWVNFRTVNRELERVGGSNEFLSWSTLQPTQNPTEEDKVFSSKVKEKKDAYVAAGESQWGKIMMDSYALMLATKKQVENYGGYNAKFTTLEEQGVANENTYRDARASFAAISKLVMSNQDPANIKKDLGYYWDEFQTTLGSTVFPKSSVTKMDEKDGGFQTERQYLDVIQGVLTGNNVELTDDQKIQFERNIGDQVAEGTGGLVGFIIKMIPLNAVGKAAGVNTLIQTLSKGNAVQKFMGGVVGAVVEEAKFGAVMGKDYKFGMGTGLALSGKLPIGWINLGSNKLAQAIEPYLNASVRGAIGGTTGMEAGMALETAVDAIMNDKDLSRRMEELFPDASTVVKRTIAEFIMNAAFGGMHGGDAKKQREYEVRLKESKDFLKDNEMVQGGVKVPGTDKVMSSAEYLDNELMRLSELNGTAKKTTKTKESELVNQVNEEGRIVEGEKQVNEPLSLTEKQRMEELAKVAQTPEESKEIADYQRREKEFGVNEEPVSDKDYKDFKENEFVSDPVLKSIQDKVKYDEVLSPRESEILKSLPEKEVIPQVENKSEFNDVPFDDKIYQDKKSVKVSGEEFEYARLNFTAEDNVFLIEKDGNEIGRATLSKSGNYLENIRIDEKYRRMGLGEKMYDYIEEQAGIVLEPSPIKRSSEANSLWEKRNKEKSKTDGKENKERVSSMQQQGDTNNEGQLNPDGSKTEVKDADRVLEGTDVRGVLKNKTKDVDHSALDDNTIGDEFRYRVSKKNVEMSDEQQSDGTDLIKQRIQQNNKGETVEQAINHVTNAFVKANKEGWFKKKAVKFTPDAEGNKVTKPSKTYNEAVDSNKKGNLWVRQTDTPSNKGRKLLVQFSSDILNTGRQGNRSVMDRYFDKLYKTRNGYDRTFDFWEVPLWMSRLQYAMKGNSDVYVIRDIKEAKEFIKSAGYDDVLFSALDINKDMILDIADAFPNQKVQVGGYVDFAEFKTRGNVSVYDTVENWAKANGVKDTGGYSYQGFFGTKVIPRLKLSNGCKYVCAFCTVPKDVVELSKKDIMEQVKSMQDLDSKLVYLDDKTFGQAKNYDMLPEIYNEIMKYNPEFEGFIVQTTALDFNRLSDDFLQKAHIKYVELGVETYNNDILKALKKPQAFTEKVDIAVEKMRKNGIKFIPNIVVGFEGETAQTYKNTLDFIKKNEDIVSHINVYNLALYKGTELANSIEAKTAMDLNENVTEKSFYTKEQNALNEKALNDFGELGIKLLDKDPYSKETKKPEAKKQVKPKQNKEVEAQVQKDLETDKDGNITLYHYGNNKKVIKEGFDPEKVSTSGAGKEKRTQGGATFFYVSKSKEPMVSGDLYVVKVKPSELYPISKDPLGLKPQIEALIDQYNAGKKPFGDRTKKAEDIAEFAPEVLRPLGYKGLYADWTTKMESGVENTQRVELFDKSYPDMKATETARKYSTANPTDADIRTQSVIDGQNVLTPYANRASYIDTFSKIMEKSGRTMNDFYTMTPEQFFSDKSVLEMVGKIPAKDRAAFNEARKQFEKANEETLPYRDYYNMESKPSKEVVMDADIFAQAAKKYGIDIKGKEDVLIETFRKKSKSNPNAPLDFVMKLTLDAEGYKGKRGEAAGGFTDDPNYSGYTNIGRLSTIEFPELLDMAKDLIVRVKVRGLRKGVSGMFSGTEKRAMIKLSPDLFKDGNEMNLARTMAHEIGHAADWLPDKTSKGHNILGHIASIKGFLDKRLAFKKGMPGDLTPDDYTRLKEQAMRDTKDEVFETEIDEEITRTMPVTPDDVLNIWNTVEGTLNKDLYDYVARLSAAEKKQLILMARRGMLPDNVKKFDTVITEKTGRKITTQTFVKGDWQKEFKKNIEEEVAKRQLFELEEIKKELTNLSEWWRPYDKDAADAKFAKYRNSADELYADAISVLLNSPVDLAQKAPKFFEAFMNYLGEKPELEKSYLSLQKLLNEGSRSDLVMKRINQVRTSSEQSRKIMSDKIVKNKENNKPYLSKVNKWINDFVSMTSAVMRTVSKVKGEKKNWFLDKDLTDSERVMNHAEKLKFINENQVHYVEEMKKNVYDRITNAGVDYADFEALMEFRRISLAEQYADKAKPGGRTAKDAQEAYDRIENDILAELGQDGLDAVHDAMQYFYDTNYEVMKAAKESGVISPEAWKIIERDKDLYVTNFPLSRLEQYDVTASIKEVVGTLSETSDVFVNTQKKMMAIMHVTAVNNAKRSFADFTSDIFPESEKTIQYASDRKTPISGFKKGNDGSVPLVYYVDGKKKAINVPPDVEKMFSMSSLHSLDVVSNMFNIATNAFKGIVTQYNPKFAFGTNPVKDVLTSVRNGYTLISSQEGKGVWGKMSDLVVVPIQYIKGIPNAFIVSRYMALGGKRKKFVKMLGYLEDYLRNEMNELVKNGVVSRLSGIDIKYDESNISADDVYRILNKEDKLGWSEKLKGFGLHNWYTNNSRALEYMSKVLGFSVLKKSGFSSDKAAFLTRTHQGTPNFREGGEFKKIAGAYMPFYNVLVQAMRSDYNLAVGKPTSVSYWMGSLTYVGVPAVLTGLAAGGFFGDDLKKAYIKLGSYYSKNYLTIPISELEDGSVMGLTTPMNDVEKMLYSTIHSFTKASVEDDGITVDKMKKLGGNIFEGSSGMTPTLQPLIKVALAAGAIQAGGNFYDTFLMKNVVTQGAMNRGGTEKWVEFSKWAVNKVGLSGVAKLFDFDQKSNTTTEYVIKNMPVLNAFLRTPAGGIEQTLSDNDKYSKALQEYRDVKYGVVSDLADKYKEEHTDKGHKMEKNMVDRFIRLNEDNITKELEKNQLYIKSDEKKKEQERKQVENDLRVRIVIKGDATRFGKLFKSFDDTKMNHEHLLMKVKEYSKLFPDEYPAFKKYITEKGGVSPEFWKEVDETELLQ